MASRWLWWLTAAMLALASTPGPPAQPVAITWPLSGSSVEGEVVVRGRTAVPRFQKARLEFQPLPASHPQATPRPHAWLPLAVLDEPVVQGVLATWDTEALAPGPYVLRLQVALTTGQTLEHRVVVWVGTAPPEGPTPSAKGVRSAAATPSPSPLPVTPRPWPQPLDPLAGPPAPAQVALPPETHRQALAAGMAVGLLVVLVYLGLQARKG